MSGLLGYKGGPPSLGYRLWRDKKERKFKREGSGSSGNSGTLNKISSKTGRPAGKRPKKINPRRRRNNKPGPPPDVLGPGTV